MAYSINRVTLVGNIGSDPKVREITQGQAVRVSQFTLATNRGGGKDKDGKDLPVYTQWHNIVAWRRLAEIPLKKGDKVCVMGEIQYREYEANGQKRYITEIVASEIFPIVVERKADNSIPSGYVPQQESVAPIPTDLPPF